MRDGDLPDLQRPGRLVGVRQRATERGPAEAMDQVRGLQRAGYAMTTPSPTDPIGCPECDGSGEQRIGTLRLMCRFCQGRGEVGGDYEPAEGGHRRTDGYRTPEEGEAYDPDVHGPLPAVWDSPAADETSCAYCLGQGTVINLGGDLRTASPPTHLLAAPCPVCGGGGKTHDDDG